VKELVVDGQRDSRQKRALFATLLLLASLIVGAGAHYFIFSASFFSSPLTWLGIFLRTALAFLAGNLWRRAGLSSLLLALIYLAIECGPIMMALWAYFNYSETGQIGFGLSYWMIPAATDLVMLWIGAHMMPRHHPVA
jgi:hypothetical protein